MTAEEAIYGLAKFNCEKCSHKNEENCGYDYEPDCAIYMAVEALEKQRPKKPEEAEACLVIKETTSACPVCGSTITSEEKYCHWCGQRIDWSEVEK